MRVIVGISGASGAVYGLELLRELSRQGHEVHAVLSAYGEKVLAHECGMGRKDLLPFVHALYGQDDMAAPIASGSFSVTAMAVAPCSMRSLAAIATGLAGNLLCRAADVMLKERRNLILAVRETPLSALHLENMLKLARLGVGITPLCPGFYHAPASVDDLVRTMVGRIMESMGLANGLYTPWAGMPPEPEGGHG